MGWAFVAHRGNNEISDGNDGTTIDVSPSATLAVGSVIIVRVANIDTTADVVDAETSHISLSDTQGNTWTKIKEWSRQQAGGRRNRHALFFSKITTQIGTGDTITATWDITVTSGRLIGLEEFSIGAGNNVSLAGATGSGFSTATPSITLSGLTSATYLWLGGTAHSNPQVFTQDTDYANDTDLANSTGAGNDKCRCNFGSRVFLGTSDTFDPSFAASVVGAILLGALEESSAGQFFQSIADTASLTESILKRAGLKRAETLGLTETLAMQVAKRIQETAGLSETRMGQIQKKLAETLSLNESLITSILRAQNMAESVGLSEALPLEVKKFFSSGLSLTEELKLQVRKQLGDAASLVEAKTHQAIKNISESLGLTENLSSSLVKLLSVSDSASLGEDLAILTGKPISETLSTAESLRLVVIKSIGEPVTLTEQSARQAARQLAEIMSLIESERNLAAKSFGETMVLAEALSRVTGKPISETLGLGESLVASAVKRLAVADLASLSESLSLLIRRALSETLSPAEQLQAQKQGSGQTFTLNISDVLGLTEIVSSQAIFAPGSVGLDAILAQSLVLAIGLAQSVGLVEARSGSVTLTVAPLG